MNEGDNKLIREMAKDEANGNKNWKENWAELMKVIRQFLAPYGLSEEEKQRFKKNVLKAIAGNLFDADWLRTAVQYNISIVPYLMVKFELDNAGWRQKLSLVFLRRYRYLWEDILTDIPFIVQVLKEDPNVRPLMNDPKVIQYLNNRITDLYEFLVHFTDPDNPYIDAEYKQQADYIRKQIGILKQEMLRKQQEERANSVQE